MCWWLDQSYLPGIIDIDGEERTHSTLRIGNVTEADQGDIWCVAQYDGGMHDSDKAKLTVVGKESVCGDVPSIVNCLVLENMGLKLGLQC